MTTAPAETRPAGLVGIVGRLVAPNGLDEGRLTGLLGLLWLTGGLWLLVATLLDLFDDGWPEAILGVAGVAVVLGSLLLWHADRHLPVTASLAIVLLGAVAIALATYWAGQQGAAAPGVLYVYVTCFAYISLPRQAIVLSAISAALHLAALVVGGYSGAPGMWALTWGAAMVTGLLAGAAVEWLRGVVALVKEADELKTRFVAVVSHELRTPLTAILGFTETLQHGWHHLDEGQRRRFMTVIDRQAQRQLRLVDDLLTMSTLTAESVTPATAAVDVASALERVVETLPFDVEVQAEHPSEARVDPVHLEQILENLLINADRYGEPPIVARARPGGDQVCIEVIDHGPGIEGGFDSDVLEPFTQGDSGDRRRSSGVGLGLTICRELVEANRGCMEYHDADGQGATVRVYLPA